ncbi:histidine kinase [Actinoplanes sp. SE50]|uniref:sensor histidine kinase n=1 Tax=unclassified Actinoplanes TaxID=2626549 RepID=UPI00023ECFD1|nr:MULTISPECIES: nitrate- and nitrite sensing domain-containing protein [unclassified Actinoplanes]AEV82145.1 Phytochrome B [Actinoplanes sp. SE50/110]ATO80544.1 histidine kinase [Actinoplanes sp. SE50]SLL97950.1 nitrate and nitrite sensing domain-containing protein [Actinoplanes sp. SE50/110]
MRSRNWSIRSKIIAMVAVPLAALLALWVFATAATAGPAMDLLNARDAVHRLGDPGLQLIAQLQRERHFSAVYLSARKTPLTDLRTQRAATDQAIDRFRTAVRDLRMSDDLSARTGTMLADLSALTGVRGRVDTRDIDVLNMMTAYGDTVDAGFEVSTSAAVFFHEKVDREVRGLIAGYRGQEYLSRVDAVLAGANAAGRIDQKSRGRLIEFVATSRYLLSSGVQDMPEQARGDYARLITGSSFVQLDIMQNQLIDQSYTGGTPPVSGAEWQATYDQVSADLRAFELRTVDEVASDATPLAITVFLWLGLSALVGLGAFLLAIWVSVRVGRSIVGRLIKLRREALEMATHRLPTVVRRLQHGEAVDVEVETPPLEYGKDEIGQLGQAFNDVQRTAVQSAVDEANVRRGINEVFLNIARRSQTLLHRQLSLLDRMERRETEPQELEDLYRVDHLATRMRRHAEDLVILAGAAPGRGWRNPVPVIDVIRGAISEVEDYKRVDIRSVASAAMLGRSVGDVIHLLAELIENAGSYSPPHTRVQVSGQLLPNGYVIEVEDRGLGMTADAIEVANRRLAEPPDFDPADSARLGLFVVAQLADRHHIRVSLQASPYGGITAVVLVPAELITEAPQPAGTRGRGEVTGDLTAPLAAATTRPALPAPRVNGESLPAAKVESLNGRHRTEPEAGGPTPSSVASGLTPDGLVQRKRVRRAPETTAGLPPEATPSRLGDVAGALGVGSRAVPRNSGPVLPTSAAPLFTTPEPPLPVAPTSAAPMFAAPVSAPPADVDGGGEEVTAQFGLDGLPKRVRQASLAPQLRNPVVEPPRSTAPERTPEQVRTLMSALQRGTTRGRIQASRDAEEANNGGESAGGNDVYRPEKDA